MARSEDRSSVPRRPPPDELRPGTRKELDGLGTEEATEVRRGERARFRRAIATASVRLNWWSWNGRIRAGLRTGDLETLLDEAEKIAEGGDSS